jgi:hypothetical protein
MYINIHRTEGTVKENIWDKFSSISLSELRRTVKNVFVRPDACLPVGGSNSNTVTENLT